MIPQRRSKVTKRNNGRLAFLRPKSSGWFCHADSTAEARCLHWPARWPYLPPASLVAGAIDGLFFFSFFFFVFFPCIPSLLFFCSIYKSCEIPTIDNFEDKALRLSLWHFSFTFSLFLPLLLLPPFIQGQIINLHPHSSNLVQYDSRLP